MGLETNRPYNGDVLFRTPTQNAVWWYMSAATIFIISIPIIYSGGITSLDDLKVLYDLGTDYVVIGSALYKGVINFEDTIQFQK